MSWTSGALVGVRLAAKIGQMTGRLKNVKDLLAEAGLQLFFANGFNGTGVKEIVDAIGVPKGSFYAYYPSKEALGAAAIDRYWAGADQRLAPLASDAAPEIRIRDHFRLLSALVVEQDFRNGCLLGNFSAEVAASSEMMRETLADRFQRWQGRLEEVLRQAESDGTLREGVDPAAAAEFLITSWEGAVLKAKADRSATPLERFETFALQAIFARP